MTNILSNLVDQMMYYSNHYMHGIMQSLTNDPKTMAVVMSSLLFVTGFLRNDYGELSRALVREICVCMCVCWGGGGQDSFSIYLIPSYTQLLEFANVFVGPRIRSHLGANELCSERVPNSPTPKSHDSTESTQTIPSRR